jgi:plasmid stabilization system protein ParE
MAYNYRLSEEAESDIYEGYEWYKSKRKNLGEEFLASLDQAREAITSNPKTYGVRYKNKVRAFVVNRFPYMVLYVVKGNDIDVISVFNTNQHPERWKKRVK